MIGKLNWVLLLAALLAVGCECKPGRNFKRYNVNVTLDDTGLKDETGKTRRVEVNIIGVSRSEYPRWEAKSVNEFWEPGDEFRATPAKAIISLNEKQKSATFSTTQPVWDQWNKPEYLFVLLRVAGIDHKDAPGNSDPWRLVLPLDKCYWPGSTKTLEVTVKQTGINTTTTPRPTKN